jgi:hypothetical protein
MTSRLLVERLLGRTSTMVVFEGCFGNVRVRLPWLRYFDDRITCRNLGRYRYHGCQSRFLARSQCGERSARAPMLTSRSAVIRYAIVTRWKSGGAMKLCLWYEHEDGRKLRSSGGEDFDIRMSPPRHVSSSFICIHLHQTSLYDLHQSDPYLISQ